MAKRKPVASKDARLDGEPIPAWKSQSVERSLQSARHAQDRSDRFVKAGIELIRRRGDTGFTVQDVVDQSGMSIRTFYLFFATKDDLLLAIHETILASEVEPRLRRKCDAEPDPVTKIKVFIDTLFELTRNSAPVTRGFMVQQHRLAESRPDDLDRAMEPQLNLVLELVQDAAAAGRFARRSRRETSALLLHHLVHGIVEDRVLGSPQVAGLSPDQVWVLHHGDRCRSRSAYATAPLGGPKRRPPGLVSARTGGRRSFELGNERFGEVLVQSDPRSPRHPDLPTPNQTFLRRAIVPAPHGTDGWSQVIKDWRVRSMLHHTVFARRQSDLAECFELSRWFVRPDRIADVGLHHVVAGPSPVNEQFRQTDRVAWTGVSRSWVPARSHARAAVPSSEV